MDILAKPVQHTADKHSGNTTSSLERSSLERDGNMLFAKFGEGPVAAIECFEEDLGKGEFFSKHDTETAIFFAYKKLISYTLTNPEQLSTDHVYDLITRWESALELAIWHTESVEEAARWKPLCRAFESTIVDIAGVAKVESIIRALGLNYHHSGEQTKEDLSMQRRLAFSLLNQREGALTPSFEVLSSPHARQEIAPLSEHAIELSKCLQQGGCELAAKYLREKCFVDGPGALDCGDTSVLVYLLFKNITQHSLEALDSSAGGAQIFAVAKLWQDSFMLLERLFVVGDLNGCLASPLMTALEDANNLDSGLLAKLETVWAAVSEPKYLELSKRLSELLRERERLAA